ncbi:S8 family serine peptidase [Spartinivicinus ruber]|uniref:S8 family serine peptidase n=1 Tax=Spartinivicinus ruber TaxID=2683272 RepID=UPI0013D22333|nr:S8 family serine peptidase [Spartinivicinus ruber]
MVAKRIYFLCRPLTLLICTLFLLLSIDIAWSAPPYFQQGKIAKYPSFGTPRRTSTTPHMSQNHILIELGKGVDESKFLERARGQGLRKIGRVYGSRWLAMAIPVAMTPRGAAAAARGLPGVVRSTPDLMVEAYHHLSPATPPYVDDPYYIFDDNPSTKPCNPCTAEELIDQWNLFRVDAENGWNTETGGVDGKGNEIVIAIIDSGIDLDHDDLADNIWHNPGEVLNGIDDDGNGFVDDLYGMDFVGAGTGSLFDDPSSQDANPDIPDGGMWVQDFNAPWWWRFDGDPASGDALDNNGDFYIDLGVFHGTLVAGVAAAATNNINPATNTYEGFAGACWNCKLMAVRMIDAEGGGLMSNAAAAIYYAADNGADVINASWGVDTNGLNPADVEIVRQAIEYAVGKGVIVVAATGNSGAAGIAFPAVMAEVIAIGSSNWVDDKSQFSSYAHALEIPDDGVDNDGNGWVDDVVDVVAPGEFIWNSTVISAYEAFLLNGWDWFCCADNPAPSAWFPGEDAYTRSDGTSFSTPLVAGYIGVLLSANCDASANEVRQAIRDNALDVGPTGYDNYTGYGRLQFVVPINLGTGNCGGDGSGENQSPTANAGPDQQVIDVGKPGEQVTLSGSYSVDPDGTIVEYVWKENGAIVANGKTPTITLGVGMHDLTLTVKDDNNATDSDTVRIEVCKKSCTSSGNESPVAQDDTYNLASASDTLTINVPGVLNNDSDPNGDPLTAQLVGGPANAQTFTFNPDGSFSYTHDGGVTTNDSFTYQASDGVNQSEIATVTLTIGGGNAHSMYMANVKFEQKGRGLNVTVTVRYDSDADGISENSDAGVGKALVYGTLCSLSFGDCHFVNMPIGTGGNGQATYKLFDAVGEYEYRWTDIVHEIYNWNPDLDISNPAVSP